MDVKELIVRLTVMMAEYGNMNIAIFNENADEMEIASVEPDDDQYIMRLSTK